MSVFAGVDFDTFQVHVVLVNEDEATSASYYPFGLPGHDAFERTRSIRQAMPSRSWWEDEGVIAVGIEEPMGPGHITAKLKAVQGATLQCFPTDLLVHPISPSQWRKAAGLPGGAKKDAVQAHVREALGENPHWPQDGFDAWCLAMAVRSMVSVG